MNNPPAASATGGQTARSATLPLAGRRILVTRPEGQQRQLRAAIEAAGGQALGLPLLAIEPVADATDVDTGAAPPLRRNLQRLREFDTLIFVSANAAEHGAKAIAAAGVEPPPTARMLAVGAATAREASLRLGRPVDSPAAASGSEPLLEMPELADVAGRQVAIFRGEGGRELLARELRRRGARVTYFEVYRRVHVPDAARRLERILAAGPVDCAIVTSIEALQAWRELAAGGGCPIAAPFALPLIVPSRRVAEAAERDGFGAVANAGDAGAKAMVAAAAALFPSAKIGNPAQIAHPKE